MEINPSAGKYRIQFIFLDSIFSHSRHNPDSFNASLSQLRHVILFSINIICNSGFDQYEFHIQPASSAANLPHALMVCRSSSVRPSTYTTPISMSYRAEVI